MSLLYKKTRLVKVGGFDNVNQVLIGSDSPVSIQTMWKESIVNIENDDDPLRVVKKALIDVPIKQNGKKRKVCVKAVDVFGFESIVVKEVQ